MMRCSGKMLKKLLTFKGNYGVEYIPNEKFIALYGRSEFIIIAPMSSSPTSSSYQADSPQPLLGEDDCLHRQGLEQSFGDV